MGKAPRLRLKVRLTHPFSNLSTPGGGGEVLKRGFLDVAPKASDSVHLESSLRISDILHF